jgi:hypothetical protein
MREKIFPLKFFHVREKFSTGFSCFFFVGAKKQQVIFYQLIPSYYCMSYTKENRIWVKYKPKTTGGF